MQVTLSQFVFPPRICASAFHKIGLSVSRYVASPWNLRPNHGIEMTDERGPERAMAGICYANGV